MTKHVPGYNIDETGNSAKLREAEPALPEVSIDIALKDGLVIIRRHMNKLLGESTKSIMPSRESVSTLKECMAMLMDLKKKEAEILDNMSIEQLEKALESKK